MASYKVARFSEAQSDAARVGEVEDNGLWWVKFDRRLINRERDEDKRQAFLNQIAKILKSEVLYLDESGVDEFA